MVLCWQEGSSDSLWQIAMRVNVMVPEWIEESIVVVHRDDHAVGSTT